ncbi:phage tail tape measure protein [uncultured Lactococcus sp.]|uniref:phage tail tape measure protein n=1 Tax=uncultured Lactococcus sp. TaxID=167973 RepID=UPI00204E591E|nr:phage tail tape measure protein [uncultured Lactococcus sp.]DAK67063.1 MAG TPA: minor tail protein [Caudoviricetes sp.]
MESFSVTAYLQATDNNFVKTFNDAAKQVENFQENTHSTMSAVGKVATSTGKFMTKAVTVPLIGAGVAAAKIGGDFESQMSRVKAISGATGKSFDLLRQQAIDLGAKTAFSAKESAAGMENLASAGFDASEIMKAMPGLLDLAAVSGGDVALASENAATALRGFGLDASQAGHVADVFARAAADTNAEVADMGEAMKYIAPVANAMGLSIEEVAAAIGIMSDAGIKGSQAGTSLRGALSRLAKPTDVMQAKMDELGLSFYDSEGKMKPLREQIGMLKDAFKDLTPEQQQNALVTLYGQESLSGMMALIDKGPEKLGTLTKSLKDSDGAADKMARTMQDNMNSSLEQMMGALESAAIVIQKIIAPYVRKFADAVAGLVEKFVSAPEPVQKLVVAVGLIAAVIGPALLVFGFFITKLQALKVGLLILKSTLAATNLSFISLLLPILAVVAVVAMVIGAFIYFYKTNEKFRNKVNQVWQSILDFIQPIATAISDFIKGVFETLKNWWNENQETILSIVKNVWGVIQATFEMVMMVIQLLVTTFLAQMQAAWAVWSNVVSAIVQVAWAIISNIFSGTLKNILSIVTAVIKQIKLVIDTVMKVIQNVIKVILSAIKGDWSGVLDGIKGIVGAFGDFITGTFDNVMGLAKDLIKNGIDTIKGIFKSLSNINLLDIGKAIIDGFVKGLKSAWEAGKKFISGIGDWIREHKGPIRVDRKLLIPAGNAIMGGLNKGLNNSFKTVQNSVLGMNDFLANAINAGGSVNIGANIRNANNSIGGTIAHEVNLNKGKQPAQINIRLGKQEFKAFVEDISQAQGWEAATNNLY